LWLLPPTGGFESFGGVPHRLLLDNLKNGVIKPHLYDPQLNRTYQELAEHYGCFIDPCRVSHPKDKGKVERDVQTIRQQFRKLLAIHPGLTLVQVNQLIRQWLINDYGQRDHGTTHRKPYPTFLEQEQPQLKPLPAQPFDLSQWKQAKVHPDHYIQFNKKMIKVDLLVIDDFGFKKNDQQSAEYLYAIVDARYGVKSIILTSNRAITDWAAIFPDSLMVNPILDRLAHHSHQIILKGASYRKKFQPNLQNA